MDQWIGEVRAFPYIYIPDGWLECDGSGQPIQAYNALFAVIGSTYGATTSTTFFLPDLRGNVALAFGTAPATGTYYGIGTFQGLEAVTLSGAQLPTHSHALNTQSVGYNKVPASFKQIPDKTSFPARFVTVAELITQQSYSQGNVSPPASPVEMSYQMIQPAGATAPAAHENRQPYLPIRFAICYDGYFPSRPD
jgi:microcystin-dependent protein